MYLNVFNISMTTSCYTLMSIDIKILKKLTNLTQSHINGCFQPK